MGINHIQAKFQNFYWTFRTLTETWKKENSEIKSVFTNTKKKGTIRKNWIWSPFKTTQPLLTIQDLMSVFQITKPRQSMGNHAEGVTRWRTLEGRSLWGDATRWATCNFGSATWSSRHIYKSFEILIFPRSKLSG